MIRQLDQFNFHHRLEAATGISLVVFTAPGCGACRMLRAALMELGGHRDGINLFEVDVQRDMALVREFEVFHLPALFLYVDGSFHDEIRCESLPHKILQAVDAAQLAPAAEAP